MNRQKGKNVQNVKGFPRPTETGLNGKNWPLPWTGADGPKNGKWKHIDTDRMNEAIDDKLCILCGLELSDDWVYCLINGKPGRDIHMGSLFSLIFRPSPSTKCHPKCAIIACTFCPHLKSQTHPIMTQDGKKWTVKEFRTSRHPLDSSIPLPTAAGSVDSKTSKRHKLRSTFQIRQRGKTMRDFTNGYIDANGNYVSYNDYVPNTDQSIGTIILGESDGPDETFENYKLPNYDEQYEVQKSQEYYNWLFSLSEEQTKDFRTWLAEYVKTNPTADKLSFYDLMRIFRYTYLGYDN